MTPEELTAVLVRIENKIDQTRADIRRYIPQAAEKGAKQ